MENKLFKPVLSALFAAIICVATFIIQIPIVATGGYINLGDCFVLLGGILLGPVYGFLAAAIGSAIADILFGYFLYAPATFIIKGVMALLFGAAFYRRKAKISILNLLLFGILSEAVMVLGYFLYECFVLSYGLGAAAAIPGNTIQAVAGIFINTALVLVIKKIPKLKSLLN